ncbi:hypothetical protein AAHC03_024178 [Spirometra sp. Aus1]
MSESRSGGSAYLPLSTAGIIPEEIGYRDYDLMFTTYSFYPPENTFPSATHTGCASLAPPVLTTAFSTTCKTMDGTSFALHALPPLILIDCASHGRTVFPSANCSVSHCHQHYLTVRFLPLTSSFCFCHPLQRPGRPAVPSRSATTVPNTPASQADVRVQGSVVRPRRSAVPSKPATTVSNTPSSQADVRVQAPTMRRRRSEVPVKSSASVANTPLAQRGVRFRASMTVSGMGLFFASCLCFIS